MLELRICFSLCNNNKRQSEIVKGKYESHDRKICSADVWLDRCVEYEIERQVLKVEFVSDQQA